MKHGYTYKEARVTGGPRIATQACNTAEDFERPSVGIVERRGCLALEGASYFVSEEGRDEEVVPVGKDDVLLIPKGSVYDYEEQRRLFLPLAPACEQDSDIRYGDLWE